MTNNVFYSLLALDAYNRGYDQGPLTSEGDSFNGQDERNRKIGNAKIIVQSDVANGDPGVAAGFYAIAYHLGDEMVISYRASSRQKTVGAI